jgi:predicted alpha/beta superfamily hydrolase
VNSSVTGVLLKYSRFPSTYVDAREVDIWIPPGYETSKRKRYPVLYVQDGQNLFDSAVASGGKEWGMDEAMTRLTAIRKVRSAFVVGIWSTPKRSAEYMPQKAVAEGSSVIVSTDASPIKSSDITSDEYLKFVVNELKRFIDRNYRTKRGRKDTFIMGSEMGGLISAYAVTEYPRTFEGAACLSTAWPAANGAMVEYLRTHLPSRRSHRFYFDYGTETLDPQYEPFQIKVDQAMEAAGYKRGKNWQSLKFPGAAHDEADWARRINSALMFMLHH